MKTPIAVFAYNRPTHLTLALEALARCKRFSECQPYIFCDGPKNESQLAAIDATRQVAQDWSRHNNGIVIERDANLGLARSIVTGVTNLCEQDGRVIVVEDDLVVSPDFLDYMLQALDRYESEPNVYQISGYMYPVEHTDYPDTFFLPLTTTWGWATWARAWKIFDWNATGALEQLTDPATKDDFDLNGSYPYSRMLRKKLLGQNDSWGILWWWAVFQADGLILYPRRSLVQVGGFDGTGTHCGTDSWVSTTDDSLMHQRQLCANLELPDLVVPNRLALEKIKAFLKKQQGNSNTSVLAKLSRRFFRVISRT